MKNGDVDAVNVRESTQQKRQLPTLKSTEALLLFKVCIIRELMGASQRSFSDCAYRRHPFQQQRIWDQEFPHAELTLV